MFKNKITKEQVYILKRNYPPIAKRLKGIRLKKGISQKKLGVAAGIDPNSASARINQYERGKHMPDFYTLNKLAEVLKITILYFYAEDSLDATFLKSYSKLTFRQKEKIFPKNNVSFL